LSYQGINAADAAFDVRSAQCLMQLRKARDDLLLRPICIAAASSLQFVRTESGPALSFKGTHNPSRKAKSTFLVEGAVVVGKRL
jgi:hypothetical protein